MLGEPDQQRMAPRGEQRIGDLRWDRRELLVAGLMGGGVEAMQSAQCLVRPVLIGVGFGGGDQLAAQVRTT